MKTRFIVNAASGRAAKALPVVRAFAAARGADIKLTERRAHGVELAREAIADGCELIVAVGGDGTLNEVASALIGSTATLGLVPCGSGDGLGRHLRIHGSHARALDILTTGTPRLIDTGVADGHPFFTAAGLGFEAEIACRFNQLQRRGFLRYVTTSARLAGAWRAEPCVVHFDGGTRTVRAFTVAVGNADQYGNNARIAPDAQVDDGLLNLTIVPPVNALNSLPLLLRLFTGRISSAQGITSLTSTRFQIERTQPGAIHTDGETHPAGRIVEFSIRPGSLRIMAPATASTARPARQPVE